MINRKSKDEIKRMRHAGHIVALVHQEMKKVVGPLEDNSFLRKLKSDTNEFINALKVIFKDLTTK